jgi:hypothetical protein
VHRWFNEALTITEGTAKETGQCQENRREKEMTEPHAWTQSRAAGKIYELEQRMNGIQSVKAPESAPKASKSRPKRTANQRRNDRIMKKSHVHRADLRSRTNKYGKKGTINKSQNAAAWKEARKRAKKEMGVK